MEPRDLAITDFDTSLRDDMQLLRKSPGVPKAVNIYGYVYNTDTDQMTLVREDRATATANNMEAIATLILSGRYIGYLPTHCAAPWARKALRSRSARGLAPSTVSMRAPSAWAVATRQAQTCSPSRRTVHAPQSPA